MSVIIVSLSLLKKCISDMDTYPSFNEGDALTDTLDAVKTTFTSTAYTQ